MQHVLGDGIIKPCPAPAWQVKSPVSGLGPKSTRCTQTLLYTLHAGGTLLFRTSQRNHDIPFGEAFTVDMWWRIAPIAAAGNGLAGSTGLLRACMATLQQALACTTTTAAC